MPTRGEYQEARRANAKFFRDEALRLPPTAAEKAMAEAAERFKTEHQAELDALHHASLSGDRTVRKAANARLRELDVAQEAVMQQAKEGA